RPRAGARGGGSGPASPRDQQDHASDEGETGEHRRNGDGLLLVGAGLDRPEVDHLLLVGEGEAADGEADYAEHDQDQPDDRGGLHAGRRPWMTRMSTMASATTSRM